MATVSFLVTEGDLHPTTHNALSIYLESGVHLI